MRGRFPGCAVIAIATALTYADAALAQEDNPNTPVQGRFNPEYAPLNLRAGAFLIAPAISLDALYDSNVFATKDDEESDIAGIIAPRVTASSNWSRHELNLSARAELAAYKEHSSNNYQDFDLIADGRVDITRDNLLYPELSFSRGHEDREDPEDENQDGEPTGQDITKFYETFGQMAYRHNFNRIYGVVRANYTKLDYDEEDGEARDRNRYGTGLRVGYMVSPRFDLFVDGSYRWIRYDETPNLDRDNEGYAIRAGAGIDITSILFGEVQVGWETVDYNANGLDDRTSPSVAAGLTWNVTPLTSVLFDASAEIDETTVSQDGEQASGKFQTNVRMSVWHELRRNVLLNAYAGYIRDDFDGIDRTDDRYRVGAGARYLINRNFYVDGNYTFVTRTSDDSDVEFDRNQVRIGITARM
jgi:hypothetical protein